MEINEFEQIGQSVFGGSRWGSQMAARTGFSTALISNIRTGKTPISDKVAATVRMLVQAPVEPPVVEGSTEHSFAGTSVEGGAKFKLMLMAQDLTSHRFVKATEVEPSLFFPAFAPKPQVVTYAAQPTVVTRLMAASSEDQMTDEEILERISSRVGVMDQIVQSILYHNFPSMIAYGAPGVGKSFSIMAALKAAKAQNEGFYSDVIKGAVRAPGLYKALFAARNGGVVVLDDSDSVFEDEDALNLLKAALDSSEERIISWRKESAWLAPLASEFGVELSEVRNFTFNGGVIFITNINLRDRINNNHKMKPHYEALISRSYYIDLTMDSTRARALRVRSVFLHHGMAAKLGLSVEQANEIIDFISENRDSLVEVSLRMATQITKVYQTNENWEQIVRVTKMV